MNRIEIFKKRESTLEDSLFSQLPDELVIKLCIFLEPRDIIALLGTCQYMYRVCADKNIWAFYFKGQQLLAGQSFYQAARGMYTEGMHLLSINQSFYSSKKGNVKRIEGLNLGLFSDNTYLAYQAVRCDANKLKIYGPSSENKYYYDLFHRFTDRVKSLVAVWFLQRDIEIWHLIPAACRTADVLMAGLDVEREGRYRVLRSRLCSEIFGDQWNVFKKDRVLMFKFAEKNVLQRSDFVSLAIEENALLSDVDFMRVVVNSLSWIGFDYATGLAAKSDELKGLYDSSQAKKMLPLVADYVDLLPLGSVHKKMNM